MGAMVLTIASLTASSSLAGLPSSEGLLTVTSSPSVATQIQVGDVARNTGTIKGLSLPAGEYEVCFGGPDGYLTPGCQTVVVDAGESTSIVGEFQPAGWLDVTVEPSTLRPEVAVDGVARDRAPLRIPVAVGEHEVCFEVIAGYEELSCRTVDVLEDDIHGLVVGYEPVSVEVTDVTIASAGAVDERGPSWAAVVTIAVTAGSTVVPDTLIEATWSVGSPSIAACFTDESGTCTLTQTGLHNRDKSVDLTVTGVDGVETFGPSVTVSR